MLLVADRDGIWLSVNPSWTRVLGWSESELVGQTSTWLEHPDDRARSRAELAKLTAGEPTLRFENRLRTRAGDYRHLSWTAVPEEGQLYCVARDVTEERERAAALRLHENIIQSDRAPICAFDTAYRLIAFNQAHSDEFFRVQGRSSQIGDVFPDLFLPEQAVVMRALMSRALTGEAFTVVEEFGDPSLIKPHWEISYTPLRDEAGTIIGALHHAQDISGRLRAEAELATAAGGAAAVAEDGGGRPAHRRHRARLQQSAGRHHRLLELLQTRMAQGRLDERRPLHGRGAGRRASAPPP